MSQVFQLYKGGHDKHNTCHEQQSLHLQPWAHQEILQLKGSEAEYMGLNVQV